MRYTKMEMRVCGGHDYGTPIVPSVCAGGWGVRRCLNLVSGGAWR
jgi:hypothetical protein